MALSGIKYIDDTVGRRRYVRIDIQKKSIRKPVF